MIDFRDAHPSDFEGIAELHARSWQENYRGIWPDALLGEDLVTQRRAFWQQRLAYPKANQRVVVVEDDGRLVGFTCALLDADPEFGALLDNLHVHRSQKGRGLGKKLIRMMAAWVQEARPGSGLCLWVLEANTPARYFYDKLGAINQETQWLEYPPGNFSNTCRYVWKSAGDLLPSPGTDQ